MRWGKRSVTATTSQAKPCLGLAIDTNRVTQLEDLSCIVKSSVISKIPL